MSAGPVHPDLLPLLQRYLELAQQVNEMTVVLSTDPSEFGYDDKAEHSWRVSRARASDRARGLHRQNSQIHDQLVAFDPVDGWTKPQWCEIFNSLQQTLTVGMRITPRDSLEGWQRDFGSAVTGVCNVLHTVTRRLSQPLDTAGGQVADPPTEAGEGEGGKPAAESVGADDSSDGAIGVTAADDPDPDAAPPRWDDLLPPVRSALIAMANALGPLTLAEVAGKAGYAHGTLRKHSSSLQRWGHVRAAGGGFVLTEEGRALIPSPRTVPKV